MTLPRATSHRVMIVRGDYAVHHVSPAYPELFMPSCSCGWEGAWVETRDVARHHGSLHVDGEASRR
jgi:hypothetical protein